MQNEKDHKLAFVEENMAAYKNIILIAHSAGSRTILAAMESLKNPKRIVKILLLFPVFANVPKSALDLNKTIQRKAELLSVGLRVFSPDVRDDIVRKLSRNMFSSYDCMNNVIPIFKEFINIGDADGFRDIIAKYEDKICFHYGANDKWTAMPNIRNMIADFPNADIKIDKDGNKHNFTYQKTSTMVSVVSSIINK